MNGLLRGLVWLGVAVTVITECLSAANALRRGWLAAAWMVVAGYAGWRARGRFGLRFERPGLFHAVMLAGILGIGALTALTALLSPPNSSDAMGYHLPRVVHWAQAGSVAFFPTHYLNEIMLGPLAEYFMLHTFILSGGDRFVNLVQWLGMAGSAVGVSLIARRMGAATRGQLLASLFAVTLPNGILQASGAKNDYLLALWLTAMVCFALEDNAWTTGLALGLAVLTKGTAYFFAPPMLLAAFGPRRALRAIPALAAGVLLLNAPQYWRNFDLSGSPLGYDSAHGDGRFRWPVEKPGWQATASNILRNLADHLGARSERWNRSVYNAVVALHARLGIDVDDPATTWTWSRWEAPRNSNHEADAHNRWHLLLLAAAGVRLLWRRRWLPYYAGILAAFVLFCAALKWLPYMTRFHLPLFVLAAPVVGLRGERIRPPAIQVILGLFLLNNARPFVFENWVRPLGGPRSLLRTGREENYFSDIRSFAEPEWYRRSVSATLESGCTEVGIDNGDFQLEYPFQALLLARNPEVRFRHAGVTNASAKYARNPVPPCAVLCLGCAGNNEKIGRYLDIGLPQEIGKFVLFRKSARGPSTGSGPTPD